MQYLEYTRNRIVFISATTIATAVLFAVIVHGINAVGVLLATAVINILVYYALPDRYSPAYIKKHSTRAGSIDGVINKQQRIQ